MYAQDTIAAIATPAGSGGIGIIKLSGPRALHIIAGFFRSRSPQPGPFQSHRLYYGHIIDPDDETVLDEVLISYMRSPATHTGEDVVEINCHGGYFLLQRVLELAVRHGARLAEPGEFTKRAFLNGRIDLTQAEAVIDIIDAQSDSSLKCAARRLQGYFTHALQKLRTALLDVAASLEALIDFPEEHFDDISLASLTEQLRDSSRKVQQLITTQQQSVIYRSGVQAIIVGKPNVGKSSLLNALLGTSRAIVTPIPGTTRDIIRETFLVSGVPVHLHDTAGIHSGGDPIEQAGIAMALQKMSEADLVLLVLDGSSPFDKHDKAVIDHISHEHVIAVINKSDLPQHPSLSNIQLLVPAAHIVRLSALSHQGIDDLLDVCASHVSNMQQTLAAQPIVVQARQTLALQTMFSALTSAAEGLGQGRTLDIVAIDVRASLDALGQLTGETVTDSILDTIFSRFCIGK